MISVGRESLDTYLGPQKFFNEIALRTSFPGVATGLAWTPFGGDILFIEATTMRGSGKLLLTGQLGAVMRESAQAALRLVKSGAETLGIDPDLFRKMTCTSTSLRALPQRTAPAQGSPSLSLSFHL
jgi:ATP-dependent Lon protease